MTASIRTAGISDSHDIAQLTAQLGYDATPSDIEARLSRMLACPDHRVLVAELEGHAVGWLHATIAEYIESDPFLVVAGLVVDERRRGQGIGRQLLAEAEKWAAERQCSVVRLWSSVARTEAHRFYERLGYTNIKTQYSFVKSVRDDGVDFSAFIPRIHSD